jgi:hypothetical protein
MREAKGGEYIQKTRQRTRREEIQKTGTRVELGTPYKVNWFLEE